MPSPAPTLRILVDNHAPGNLTEEHGFSAWIETSGQSILFDTGQSDALQANAAALGIDLSAATALVLSHGHYDHAGAVDFVLQKNPGISFFAHPNVLKTRYSLHPGSPPKTISMPEEQQLIVENLPDSRLHWVREPRCIAPGIHLTGPIPRIQPLEDTGGPFFDDPEGRCPDAIVDDQALWIDTPGGLVVLCGCCHSGLINTLRHILSIAGKEKRIRGIVGGLHLKNASSERLAATTKALQQMAPGFIVPCHCTGEAAVNHFKTHLGCPIKPGFAGQEINLAE